MHFTFPSSTNFFSSPIYNMKNSKLYMISLMKINHNNISGKKYFATKAKKTHSVFYRDSCVHAVLVIEVNIVHIEALQARFAAGSNIFRTAIDLDFVRSNFHYAKFCGYLDLLSRQLLQRLSITIN